jgi:hypothetical protein
MHMYKKKLHLVNVGIKNQRIIKYGAVKIWHASHIPPCDHNITHFQGHPLLCLVLSVLVVCCVLRAPVVLLGLHAYVHQKNGESEHIGDFRKGLLKTNQLIPFNQGESVGFNKIMINLDYLW